MDGGACESVPAEHVDSGNRISGEIVDNRSLGAGASLIVGAASSSTSDTLSGEQWLKGVHTAGKHVIHCKMCRIFSFTRHSTRDLGLESQTISIVCPFGVRCVDVRQAQATSIGRYR